ncbi:STAS domain-containing protein [Pseudomarimonas arenosa]|uniref:STAS domain-containing protein n=1 Tax=Pseudomarimonas arenosa TaxID=2774145 RepID=A0AAW3ZF48_9GAMM|nr:STAS domain-containing protein [Pseudomarimonas arenosa]MBD8524716.1 STAS domain-containing protein [Pseudomarimonas arenosa]
MPIELGSDMGIEKAGDLKDSLLDELNSDGLLEIDCSQVERVHCASLQVLTAFVRERQALGHKSRIIEPSSVFNDAVNVLALKTALGMTEPGDH